MRFLILLALIVCPCIGCTSYDRGQVPPDPYNNYHRQDNSWITPYYPPTRPYSH